MESDLNVALETCDWPCVAADRGDVQATCRMFHHLLAETATQQTATQQIVVHEGAALRNPLYDFLISPAKDGIHVQVCPAGCHNRVLFRRYDVH
jgi:hypothetical protein